MAMHVEVFRHRVDPDFQGEFDELYARMVTVVKGLKGYMCQSASKRAPRSAPKSDPFGARVSRPVAA